MRYTVKILASKEGKNVEELFTTPDIKPLGEKTPVEQVQEAQNARHVLGTLEKEVFVYCDGLGRVLVNESADEPMKDIALSAETPREVKGWKLRVEFVPPEPKKWETPFGRKVKNTLLLRRCGSCLYFDRLGAEKWRGAVTHKFVGDLKAEMWDDVTKMAAAMYRAPDFQKGDMGYCPRKFSVLDRSLSACEEFKRAPRRQREAAPSTKEKES